MKRNYSVYAMMMVMAVAAICLAASSTSMINYQGRLTDAAGAPITGSTVSVTFSIYAGDTAAVALWTETQAISVDAGVYSVQLGAANPITADLFKAADRWLGVKVSTDPEMTPRAQITSVAYAMNSKRVAGKIIQSGQGSLTVSAATSGSASITFPAAFASPPQVITGALDNQIGGKTLIVDQVTSITTTGCTVNFVVLDGATATGSANFDWIAIGE